MTRALVALLVAAPLLGACSADERRVIGRAIEAEGEEGVGPTGQRPARSSRARRIPSTRTLAAM
jgi:hypothetical protein